MRRLGWLTYIGQTNADAHIRFVSNLFIAENWLIIRISKPEMRPETIDDAPG